MSPQVNYNGKYLGICDDVAFGEINIDGKQVGDVGDVVMRDRELLAEDGVVMIIANINPKSKKIISSYKEFRYCILDHQRSWLPFESSFLPGSECSQLKSAIASSMRRPHEMSPGTITMSSSVTSFSQFSFSLSG